MNYEEAREYLDQVSKGGSVLGLDNMRELLKRLGNPQDSLKFVHISGTNGKGSVLAYLSTVFKEAGYRTGRYISPTLFSYREKIQVNEKFIGREDLSRLTEKVKAAAEEMQNCAAGDPTIFEIETALAFLYFVEQKCDIVILETGLGGALDATNVITTPVMEIIASISMDHMEFLGDTLGKIAYQKAGIIKPDTSVVSAMQQPEAMDVICNVCRERDCTFQTVDPEQIKDISYGYEGQSFSYKNWENIKISLMGSYQIKNAALALEAINALRKLGYDLKDRAVYQGMKKAIWKGRFTLISKDPVILMDGAHNPAAAEELVRSLKLYYAGKKFYYIFGMFRDKDYAQVIRLTAPMAEHIITVQTPGNPRALPAAELKEAVAEVNPSVEAAESLRMAVNQVMERIDSDSVVVIFGSLSFLGEAEMAVNRYKMEVND
nr:folylpolyglutamate synthase/dihydrofolate synthase family protein [uncultured Blautia sp.]